MYLTALPVFNEVAHVANVLEEVLEHAGHVLVVDDGSTDGTGERLAACVAGAGGRVRVIRHPVNRGYGAALATAFAETLAGAWEGLVTIDCDGQHQPRLIPRFVEAAGDPAVGADIVSGSRFLEPPRASTGVTPPAERRRVNETITAELNQRLGLSLTDAFCGFKAYTRRALESLHVSEPGYGMPLEVWVQAAAAGLRIVELPVPLVYLDLTRSFGAALDDAGTRLSHYRSVLGRALQAAELEGPCQRFEAPIEPLSSPERG